ncbi:MarR family transcriptional regulator [Arthrobacter sp. ISL-48]|uniref:MarR family winged helix-turn-helix transcriptional regulator n=1 Tax=Arthrobacter sp. ISL-48 TaxID=2819110 RepID=UPI001BE70D97|nr:MarR family transcriptional regulator [Arthrobacter sp. ISL-48]MBT2531514.1 MarR family transcriptional regulator [Arthrobacter sp. ISL-48]
MSKDEEEAWLAYILFSRQLAAGMERQLAGSGVSGADYQMLAPLAEAGDTGMRPRDLGYSAGWDRSRLAHQLGRMEKRGLVTRRPAVDDGRGTVVHLTEAGRDALRAASPGHIAWVRENFLSLMTPEDRRVLVALSERVMAKLEPGSHARLPVGTPGPV